ncbi:enoyl-CoA hydratase/isomerase family protein [Microvirga sp. 2TAF3]|uniref:enoyl-CoA hydratase/isomerase family protein n=1 Tax=Microvirga sp. 2TAF3 TaxID=3233014 RepID=UPI003F955A03
MTNSDAALVVEQREVTRVLMLNRPKQLNAMDSGLYELLTKALIEADRDDTVRVILVHGAGPSFCAGADTKEFEQLTPDKAELVASRAALTYNLHKTIPALAKPVIAAIHGYAVGGGAGLALACDIAIAEEGAKIGYPEIKHGLVAAVVMANLTKQLGRKAAFDLVATGRLVGAQEAATLGMVTRVVPAGAAFEEALKTAAMLAERVPQALQAAKKLFHAVADVPLAEGLELGRQANEAMRAYRAEMLKGYGQATRAAKSA